MYNNISAPVGAGTASAGMLAVTGIDIFWYFLAGFALVAAGIALKRIIPVRKSEDL